MLRGAGVGGKRKPRPACEIDVEGSFEIEVMGDGRYRSDDERLSGVAKAGVHNLTGLRGRRDLTSIEAS